MKDILLDETRRIQVLNGDFRIGESEMQEIALLLESNQGEWKEHPIIGANLYQLVNSKASKLDIEKRVKLQLSLDNKEYAELKNKIQTTIKTTI
ncbi:hypothetical protein ETU08_01730 [Apibacter muscae]|uniref:Uncharacterized protein n=1 Tax=Apibacter muscae TaxID=2509004 RepID=A0A563DL24_9FLAO|nr:hypothetical protein [Apibacter muscae]TWP23536.1 hypothetical protein ETU10_07370 [Apibacter muscae]TWP30504.1 hypothetical protein ETU09_00455 [Apibacter muscae]TWP31225.1 hypothetical protein ETU08_01730 [Apibacter muscae]